MYSRNTSKKNNLRRTPVFGGESGKSAKKQSEEPINEKRDGSSDHLSLPLPPPNYRGMIYDSVSERSIIEAEGIERLVENDASYCTEKMRWATKRGKEKTFSHREPPVNGDRIYPTVEKEGGIKTLLEGLKEKSFLPEDILICAMIMLMLNSNSEDDILMILVLMMLL